MRRLIKRLVRKFIRNSPRAYQILLDDLEEQGIRFLRDGDDHSMVFFPNDTVGRRMRLSGDFGRDTVRRVREKISETRTMPSKPAILELGANVGTHTVYLALEFPSARIAAVEPDTESAALLEHNLRLNTLKDRVSVVEVAVSDQKGNMRFIRDHHNRGASSLVQNSKTISWAGTDTLAQGYQEITVQVQTADWVAQTELNGHVDFVWMDVEGHETNALLGLRDTIMKSKPPIYFEYNAPRQEASHRDLLQRIIFDNYTEVHIDKNGTFTRIGEKEFEGFVNRCDLLVL